MFGLEQALGAVVSNATGGDKGAKTRSKTHLNTDQQLTTFGVVVPLILLVFVRTFTSNTFQDSSLLCSQFQYEETQEVVDPDTGNPSYERVVVKSSNANRFFMNKYCWETMEHQVLNENVTLYPVAKDTVPLSFHKLYPYYMFIAVILLSFPMIVWTQYAAKSVFTPTQYLVSGIQEAMNIAIATIGECITDGSVFEIANKTKVTGSSNQVDSRFGSKEEEESLPLMDMKTSEEKDIKSAEEIYAIFQEKFSTKKESLDTKFNAIKEFLHTQLNSNNIVRGFIFYRLANMVTLVVISVLLWHFTLRNQQSEFNCEVPFSATMPKEAQEIKEIVICSISGVKIRVWITWGWIIANCCLFVSAIMGSISEYRSVFSALRLIKITEPILVHGISLKMIKASPANILGINNLSVLLMLAKSNFSHGNKVFQMCMQAEKMASALDRERRIDQGQQDREDAETLGTSGPFLRQLVTQVLWARKEDLDDEVTRVISESSQARQASAAEKKDA